MNKTLLLYDAMWIKVLSQLKWFKVWSVVKFLLYFIFWKLILLLPADTSSCSCWSLFKLTGMYHYPPGFIPSNGTGMCRIMMNKWTATNATNDHNNKRNWKIIPVWIIFSLQRLSFKHIFIYLCSSQINELQITWYWSNPSRID